MARINYWSSSRFAKWLRAKFGLVKPTVIDSEGWRDWRKASKATSPFVHWLTDTAFDRVQDFFYWPKDRLWDLRCALNARFCDKYHQLPTKLDPWKYHEVDSRILYGMFETFIDFVEIEKAWMSVIWGQEENRKKFGYSWWEMNGWLSWLFTEKRHVAAGLHYLEWEMSLVQDDDYYGNDPQHIQEAKDSGEYGQLTHQGRAAKEQLELYNWWKNIRPNRPDPMDKSGYTAYFDRMRAADEDFFSFLGKTPEDVEESRRCRAVCDEIEEAYEKEDEEMLIRLIKIRKSLWT